MARITLLLLTLSTTLLFPMVHAWGSLGHRTVAYLASLHFTPLAHKYTTHLLNHQDISEAALFADKIAHMPIFRYSAPWHYIDAHDSPPHTCGINMTRDCSADTGCIVSAIANHTARINDPALPYWQRAQALRFTIHFFGDIVQPLHTEAEDRGGNEVEVVFGGKRTNLHSVWDSLMPAKVVGGSTHDTEMRDAMRWAVKLFAEDERGLQGECTHDAEMCALGWAEDSNRFVCEYVLAEDITGDLAGEYFEGAVEIVQGQLRKGGRALAAWINMLANEYYHGEL